MAILRYFSLTALITLVASGCHSESLLTGAAGSGAASGRVSALGGQESGGGSGGARSGGANTGGLMPVAVEVDELVGSDDSPCGPGCRLALQRPVNHGGVWPAFSTQIVADTNPWELFYATPGSSTTQVLQDSPALAYAEGTLLSYLSVPNWPAGDFVVLDTVAKTRTSYFHFDASEAYGEPYETLLSDKYLFWMRRNATTRANLSTGEIIQHFSASMQCDGGCVSEGKILCLDGDRIVTVDQETAAAAYLDDGGAFQLDAACSPDRKRMVWVDFRDPPGRGSSYFGARIGGEIYLYEVESGTIRRLTHDSETSPVTKGSPGVGTDLVVWLEPCADCPKSFEFAQEFLANPAQLVRLELTTERKCRLEAPIMTNISIHGHHAYGYWTDTKEQYLIDLDLDEPSLPWLCE